MIIDISRTLRPEIAVWPGDTRFQLEKMLKIEDGSSVNLTTIHVSSHTGTHADAPLHFLAGAGDIASCDLAAYWGPAQVVTVEKPAGPITPADLAHVDLSATPRLLVRTPLQSLPHDTFPDAIPYPDPSLAKAMADAGIILFGIDVPSMDHIESKELPGHKAIHKHGIAIIESVDLSNAPDGLYEFVALPLKILGGDGSPVRAALRPLGA